MDNMGFDDRYPAMFQPGGDDEPASTGVPTESFPSAMPGPRAIPEPPSRSPVLVDTVPHTGPESLAAHTDHATGLLEAAPAPAQPPWTLQTWAIGLSAAGVSMAAGVFVLNASTVIPASRQANPEDSLGMSATPWGWLILDAGLPLIVAGAAMVAFMLFRGSRQHPEHAKALRAGMVAVGIGALVVTVLSVFYHDFFPPNMESMSNSSYRDWPIPWIVVLNQAQPILAVFGLGVLVTSVVVRSNGSTGPVALSATSAFVSGGILLACAAFVLFAQPMFPLALGTQSVGDGMFQDIPWPQKIATLAGPLTLTGAGTLLWGVLIRASSQHPANTVQEPQYEAM